MHSSFFGSSITPVEERGEKRTVQSTDQPTFNLLDDENPSFQSINPQHNAKPHSPTLLARTAWIYSTNEEK